MKKKLVLISTSLLSSIPLTVAVSCSNDNNKKPGDKTEDTMKPGDKKEDTMKPGDKNEDSKKPKISPEQQKLLNKIGELEKNLVYAKEELSKEKALFYYKFLSSQSKTDEQESESIEDLKNEIESLYDVIDDFNKHEDLKNWVDLVYNAYLILFEKQELLDDL
ncbi:hypothetical protein E1I18_02555 [Mycoplasmopsis mucosicanis]|uniref:Lipoprotein n=1 Tax=Mycoplasmopsis mucosicanis TaxID=458208 RepID=A0A507SJN6_9BACT|nr:hypothetical protein [Mycoplasmopsis mucosicanis]TQC51441.1 hypothetical protein E1I18_02555 [Mycoplasmopsis mucosicanis]